MASYWPKPHSPLAIPAAVAGRCDQCQFSWHSTDTLQETSISKGRALWTKCSLLLQCPCPQQCPWRQQERQQLHGQGHSCTLAHPIVSSEHGRTSVPKSRPPARQAGTGSVSALLFCRAPDTLPTHHQPSSWDNSSWWTADKKAPLPVTQQIKPTYSATVLLRRIFFPQTFYYIDPWCLHLAPAHQKITFIYNIPFPLNSLNPGFWCAPYSKMKFTPFTLLLLILAIISITIPRSLKVHTAVFTFLWFHKILKELSYKLSSQFNSHFNWREIKIPRKQNNKALW